ncbi:MAG: ATP synthase F1 subunit epsilon [Lachnospiraceae bacterium]|nr:ATP synthase F1 subunit epsilon [Lachnospiraceae bacterium]
MANTFHLQIASVDGLIYDGSVISISCRCVDGDRTILAGHTNLVTSVGMGTAKVIFEDGSERMAACIGGMLSVMNGECRLIVTTWEWKDEIDIERAKAAKKRAEEKLAGQLDEKNYKIAKAKLHRALIRMQTSMGAK